MSCQHTTITYGTLWTSNQVSGSHVKNGSGAILKGFAYVKLPKILETVRFRLSNKQFIPLMMNQAQGFDVTITKLGEDTDGFTVFQIDATGSVGVLSIEGTYDIYEAGTPYSPFSMDIFVPNPKNVVEITAGKYQNMFTATDRVAHTFQSDKIELEDGIFKITPTASFRIITFSIRSTFILDDPAPCEWFFQLRRPRGDIIASMQSTRISAADDLPERELHINSYVYGVDDPFVDSGFTVGFHNTTGATMLPVVDDLRINIFENPHFLPQSV